MYLLHRADYPERDEVESLPFWVDVQADLSLCLSHRSYFTCDNDCGYNTFFL